MATLVKMVLSALIIGLVAVVARRSPALGGWLAALPLISLLSAFWLYTDHQPNTQLVHFFTGVLWGIIPTVVLLFVVVICLRQSLPFFGSICIGLLVWIVYFLIAQRLGWFGL